MQVISRRVNEGLVIGEDIYVTVLEVQDHCVRLGISHPHSEPSYWEETLYLDRASDLYELQVH